MENIKENNHILFKKYSKNKDNIEIRNKIVLNNLNLVPFTIKRYHLFKDGFNDYEEMLQEGYLALVKAVENFDNNLNSEFSSYAVKCILSLTRNRMYYNMNKSLDDPINQENEDITLGDTIKDESIDIEKEAINQKFFSEIRKELASSLNEIEFSIIKGYYGINEKEKSTKQLAENLKINVQQVKDIRSNTLQKIKKTKYFRMLYLEMNPISYYPTHDLQRIPSVNNFNKSSPVERIVLEKQKQEKQLLKKTLKHIKSTF